MTVLPVCPCARVDRVSVYEIKRVTCVHVRVLTVCLCMRSNVLPVCPCVHVRVLTVCPCMRSSVLPVCPCVKCACVRVRVYS